MTDPLRVAAIQLDCSGPKHLVIRRALEMVRDAARRGASIVCLPEHWVPRAERGIENVTTALGEIAKDTGTYIISGGEFTKRNKTTVVESILLGPDGEVGRQQKTHLFGRERRIASPGNAYSVLGAGRTNVGITICHDLVYPEVARIFALKGVEVIFAPARISEDGLAPWRLYVEARALENRIPIVSPNALQLPTFPGHSLIVGFSIGEEEGIVYPRVLASAKTRPAILTAELDLDGIRAYREERLRARRPEIYTDLVET